MCCFIFVISWCLPINDYQELIMVMFIPSHLNFIRGRISRVWQSTTRLEQKVIYNFLSLPHLQIIHSKTKTSQFIYMVNDYHSQSLFCTLFMAHSEDLQENKVSDIRKCKYKLFQNMVLTASLGKPSGPCLFIFTVIIRFLNKNLTCE